MLARKYRKKREKKSSNRGRQKSGMEINPFQHESFIQVKSSNCDCFIINSSCMYIIVYFSMCLSHFFLFVNYFAPMDSLHVNCTI